MINVENTTASKIKALRQKLGKNQAYIADKLGISIPAYSKIETGITEINLPRLKQIAALFEVDPEFLLPGIDVSEKVRARYKQYEEQIAALQQEVQSLQTKLIKAYEEIGNVK